MGKDIEAGSFYDGPDTAGSILSTSATPTEEEIAREYTPRSYDLYAEILRTMAASEVVDVEQIRHIYVPASGVETSPSLLFPEATVTYLDSNGEAVAALTQAGYTAHEGDANTFSLSSAADFIVLLNTNGITDYDVLMSQVREGGYIIEHNYMSPPPEGLSCQDDLTFLGTIRRREGLKGEEFYFDEDSDEALLVRNDIYTGESVKKIKQIEAYLFQRQFGNEDYRSTLPEAFKKKFKGMGEVIFGDVSYPYAIIDPSLEKRLPNFVGFNLATNFLFISEDVPETYREFILGHEIDEFTNRPEVEGRCSLSVAAELARVPSAVMAGYVPFRTQMFQDLISYYEAHNQDGSANAMLHELQMSLSLLTSQQNS